jgi:predicted RNA-binding protein with TRAM domain
MVLDGMLGFEAKTNKKSKEVELNRTGVLNDEDVTEIGRQGDGIARVQGFVVFVKNGKVGQKVKIQVNQVGNRFATAAIVA